MVQLKVLVGLLMVAFLLHVKAFCLDEKGSVFEV